MNATLKNVLAAAMVAVAAQASAQITFYEDEAFAGRSFSTEQPVSNFKRSGFNDRASSAIIVGNRWEICENADFGGRCVTLQPGRYASFAAMGLNDRVSSVRMVPGELRVDDNRRAPATESAQITFYELEGFGGRTLVARQDVGDLRRESFNDRASSVVVTGGYWEVCEAAGFNGRCVTLRSGQYPSLAAMGLDDRVSSVRVALAQSPPDDNRRAPPAPAQVIFYENEGFAGRAFSTQQDVGDFRRQGFNDRASSMVVVGERWEACDAAGFTGRCVVLGPGRYASLSAMGLDNNVSSVRSLGSNPSADDGRYAVAYPAANDYRRRDNEPLYQADVVAVRAVMRTADQRCWVEREQVPQERSNASVPGAVVGAVIGGILGHQVGNGRGKDLATAGGAVAGAVVGANVGRDSGPQQAQTRDVQRCAGVPNQDSPDYWDVTYNFRGQEHRMQMSTPPGLTVNVNAQGEPRG
jgi:uncharacterized protein YcfJ